jgi:hypothetical protein
MAWKNEMCEYIWHVLWDRKGANKVLVGKPVGKAATCNPKRRFVHNIKMDLQETGPEDAWTGLICLRAMISG